MNLDPRIKELYKLGLAYLICHSIRRMLQQMQKNCLCKPMHLWSTPCTCTHSTPCTPTSAHTSAVKILLLDNCGSLDLSLATWFSDLGIPAGHEHFLKQVVTDFETVILVLSEMTSTGKWPTNTGY